MKKKVIWLMVTGLMTLALLAVSCYSAPAVAPTTPAAPPATPATPSAPAVPTAPTTPTVPAVKETTPIGVQIVGSAFVPATITVAIGTTVTWTNQDSVPHTVSSALLDSGTLSRGATFSYTLNQKGTFEYQCNIHPSMNGKVIVQ